MRMLIASAALGAGILAVAADGRAQAADFGDPSVQGPYSIFLNGTITFTEGKPLFLPTWSVGVIQANGQGRLDHVEAVVNVGGCVILKQAGTGTYSVNPNGTGRAEAQLTSELAGAPNAQCPNLDQGLLPENVLYAFDFVINADEHVVGISWEGPNGPIAAFGSSGQAKPQVRLPSTRATPK